MKIIAVVILIFLVMTQTFSKWIMIAEFSINRDFIAKNLCENRYKPKLHCNGKCLLMKKMATEENQSAPQGSVKLNWETFLFLQDHTEYLGKFFPEIPKRFLPWDSFWKFDSYTSTVFRPPLD